MVTILEAKTHQQTMITPDKSAGEDNSNVIDSMPADLLRRIVDRLERCVRDWENQEKMEKVIFNRAPSGR